MKKTTRAILILLVLAGSGLPPGQSLKGMDDAARPVIVPEVKAHLGQVVFKVTVDPDYHITDRKHGFFTVRLKENDFFSLGRVEYPPGEPYEGEMVYRGQFRITAYLRQLRPLNEDITLGFNVGFQVCQETPLEMCLAPDSAKLNVPLDHEGFQEAGAGVSTGEGTGLFGNIEKAFGRAMARGSLLVFIFAFVAGFLASLTPCVYPIIPIVMGYVGSRSRDSKGRGFTLSLIFSLGLSLVYAILGVVAASTGSIIGAGFQNPVIVVIVALIFLIMGLSLAGLFEIPVPSRLSSRIQSAGKGGFFGALSLGGISAIIAAPCVGPVLIAILTMVSQTGNLVYGFLLTFVFSMGLSVLFVVIGTFSGVLSALPKGGRWMSAVKYLFSVLLISGGIVILSKVVPPWIHLLLWGIFLVGLAVLGGVFSPRSEEAVRQRVWRVILVLILLFGVFLFFRGLDSGPLTLPSGSVPPVEKQTGILNWESRLETALERAAREDKLVMVDTYTDWCTVCKKLEEKTFEDPRVREVLKELVLVKIDFTREDPQNRRVKERYQVIGFPTVLFLNSRGEVLDRFSTFLDKTTFLKRLDALFRTQPEG